MSFTKPSRENRRQKRAWKRPPKKAGSADVLKVGKVCPPLARSDRPRKPEVQTSAHDDRLITRRRRGAEL
jgi:hypothetical protein